MAKRAGLPAASVSTYVSRQANAASEMKPGVLRRLKRAAAEEGPQLRLHIDRLQFVIQRGA